MAAPETALVLRAPPLPPELWNLAVILTICALMAWMVRVTRLMLAFADLRYAVNSDAVLYLKDLGASLHVLQRASMWHLQQLLRTNVEAASTKMKRVQIPFDVLSSSLEIKRTSAADASSTVLSFQVRSSAPCSVQVLWSVRSESLDAMAQKRSSSESSSSIFSGAAAAGSSPRQLIPPVLRRLSMDRTMRALRAAPASLSRIRRQRRRHELQDAELPSELSPVATLPAALCGSPAFQIGDFEAHSELMRCDPSLCSFSERASLFTVTIPSPAVRCPPEELRSLMDEVDSHAPASPPPPASASSPSPTRYSAVIVLRSLAQPPVRTSLFSKLGVGRDPTKPLQDAASTTTAVCQCVALDFLPTPLKIERFSPVVVKKISYTKTAAYVSQEIYGRDVAASSEFTICLEGVLSVVLLPCRHLCVCRVCLDEIDRCPICRARFTTWICYNVHTEQEQEQEQLLVQDQEQQQCSGDATFATAATQRGDEAAEQLQAKVGT